MSPKPPLPLAFKAGPQALSHIQEHGVQPAHLRAIAGAAGGPKWLVLAELDKLLFGEWLKERQQPLPLVGSSIGSWRFAAALQSDPTTAIDTLRALYTEQQFSATPDLAEVTAMGRHILSSLLGERGAADALGHPWGRLHVITAHCQGLIASDNRLPLTVGLARATLSNSVQRVRLGRHLHRHVFADPRTSLPRSAFPGFRHKTLPLNTANIADALLASGSIPFVLEAVTIEGRRGYRDGGLIDYHMDLPLAQQGLVLMPHFSQRCVSGWLDKGLPWRSPKSMQRHLIIHPTDAWIRSLPNQKIPDRQDFKRYRHDYSARIAAWRTVAERSRELADCLAERLAREDWLEHIEPLPF